MNAPSTVDLTFGLHADGELAEVLDRYLQSLEAGAPLDVEFLALQHPRIAVEIRAYAASVDALHRATHQFAPNRSDAFPTESNDGRDERRRLGDFALGPELGRGGMGIVYEAQQISLHRRVALKVLPFAAMWDQKQIARFKNEAQAAAQLHHPHIVPVFAVGEERGVHFYAMQLIAGRSLDQLIVELRRQASEPAQRPDSIDRAATTVAAQSTQRQLSRLAEYLQRDGSHASPYHRTVAEYGVQAAEALHYAHECGVIHRDVKPSNLLVDDCGKLWIADFGLARTLDSPHVTLSGDLLGTLRYMSPEQAAGKGALVDPRSDVYSLGATLYELLTLRPAFPHEDRQTVLRAIAEQEPAPPRSLNPKIPVDLETIVLHALAKDRDDRYESAAELAADLTRFLEGKPALARRPTALDRAGKWVRRHRVLVAVAALCLLTVTLVSTGAAVLLSRQRDRTQAALAASEASWQQARRVVDRFGGTFSLELARLPGSGPLRQAVLTDTLAYYQDFIAKNSSDPTLKADLAATHFQTGTIAGQLGRQSQAESSFQQAADLYRQLAVAATNDADGETSADAQGPSRFHVRRAACLNNLALLFAARGRFDDAGREYSSALQLLASLAALDPHSADAARLQAEVLTNQGLMQRQCDEPAAARASLTRAIDLLQAIASRSPDDSAARYDLALALNNRSFVEQQSDWQAAQDSCEAALTLLEPLVEQAGQTTASLAYRGDLALCLNNLGAILSHRDLADQAVVAYRRAIDVQQALVRQAPGVVQHRSDLAITWNNLGQALTKLRKDAEAESAYDQSQKLFEELAGDYDDDVRYRSSLAGVLNNRAMAAEAEGDFETAFVRYRAAIENQRHALDRAPEQRQYREFLSKHYFNYGRALRAAGRPIEAVEAARLRRQLWPDDGEQLYQSALELAAAAELIADDAGDKGGKVEVQGDELTRKSLAEEARTTLQQAVKAGFDLSGETAQRPLPPLLAGSVQLEHPSSGAEP